MTDTQATAVTTSIGVDAAVDRAFAVTKGHGGLVAARAPHH